MPYKKLVYLRLVYANFLALFLQYSGLQLSILYRLDSPIWFASGSALALLFLRGSHILPGIWLGTTLAFKLAGAHLSLSIIAACLFSLQAYLSLQWQYRIRQPSLLFTRHAALFGFLIMNTLICLIASVVLLQLFHIKSLWLAATLANLNGILIIGLGLCCLDAYFPIIGDLQLNRIKGCLFSLLLLALLVLVFLYLSDLRLVILTGLVIMILTSINSYSYGWCGAISCQTLSAAIISMHALFAGNSIWVTAFLTLQTVLGLIFSITR